jgi:isopenicillin-N epimerase
MAPTARLERSMPDWLPAADPTLLGPDDDARAEAIRADFPLDPAIDFLNHGSFGSCPRALRGEIAAWQDRFEARPTQFVLQDWLPAFDAARTAAADFLGAERDGLVFVPNATTGINAVLRSTWFAPDDELLTTNLNYNAVRNALEFVADEHKARVVTVDLPFPIADPGAVVERVLAAVTPRTRLVLIDHVTSATGLVMPIEELAPPLAARGIHVLVDGAHGPGMLDLDLRALAGLGVTWYAGNFHKWVCGPKGTGFLYVHDAAQRQWVRPTVISHGANWEDPDHTRFELEFVWPGTIDPAPFLAMPAAFELGATRHPDGWPGVRRRNRTLALTARRRLCDALGVEPPAPESMIGTLAAVPVPGGSGAPRNVVQLDPLNDVLRDDFAIEVPVMRRPAPQPRVLRISAAVYNTTTQYDRLAQVLPDAVGIEHERFA